MKIPEKWRKITVITNQCLRKTRINNRKFTVEFG